jgi:hypothetical protein
VRLQEKKRKNEKKKNSPDFHIHSFLGQGAWEKGHFLLPFADLSVKSSFEVISYSG